MILGISIIIMLSVTLLLEITTAIDYIFSSKK